MNNLYALGWDASFETQFQPHSDQGLIPARIAIEQRSLYQVMGEDGPLTARCSGRFIHHISDRASMPTVGDWVAVDRKTGTDQVDIQAVLPRRSEFSRAAAGRQTSQQIIAANIDTVFLVTGLDHNFNLRRIERYLTVARDSGADPVIVLNKADLCADTEIRRAEVEAVARGVPVTVTSAVTGRDFDEIQSFMRPGKTVALLGSSGVGKSTLVNRLLGREIQDTGPGRIDDGRGRHTTTTRNLFVVPTGGILIDTPGLREIGLWETDVDQTFDDLVDLASRCRFSNCNHDGEPGCAVREAVETGALDPGRLTNWRKLQREQAFAIRQQDEASKRRYASAWKQITTQTRQKGRFGERNQDQ